MKRKSLLILSSIILSAMTVPDEVRSEIKYYDAGSGSWFNGTSWSTTGAPVDGDFVIIPATGSGFTVTYDSNSNSSLQGLDIAGGNGSATLRITAPTAYIETGSIWLGSADNGQGSIEQEGATVISSVITKEDGTLTRGSLNIVNGSYALTGGDLYTEQTKVGIAGTGTFTHNGTLGPNVNHETNELIMGYNEGSRGVYNLGAGSLTSELQIVGYAGTGEFVQSAPLNSLNTTGRLSVGYDLGAVGTYDMQGGWLFAGNETIGEIGTGTFTHWGGLNEVAGALRIGSVDFRGNGTYQMMGMFGGNPELRANSEYVGGVGTGSFEQFGGINTVTGVLHLGGAINASGSYVLDGWGNLSASEINVGVNGAGTFIQHTGNATASSIVIGRNASSSGAYNMNMGTLTTSDMVVGQYGNGVFNQAGGQIEISGAVNIGSGTGSGTYNKSDGMFWAGSMNIGVGSGTGTFNHTGSGVTVNGALTIGENGTYNMNDGAFVLEPNLYAGSIVNNGTVNFNGGRIGTPGGICSYCGEGPATIDIVNNGTFNIGGPGERYMSGSVVNNGTMKITDTTVVFNKDFANNGAYISDPSNNYFSNLTVGADGYLVGGAGDNFYLSGDFFNYSGQTSLWDTADAYLSFTGWDIQEFYLGGWDEASSLAFAWGTLELGDYRNLLLSGGAGAALYVDNLILGAGSSLNLNGFDLYYSSLTDLGGAYYGGQLIYLANNSGTPNPVPEPSSLLLMASGIAGFLGLRRIKTFRKY